MGEGSLEARAEEGKARLAVFDFDGTSIQGNSPVLLVWHLVRLRMLAPSVVLRILLWAAAYKCRLPQNEAWVRGLVFRAFEGRPSQEVDGFLRAFCDEQISPRFREQAEAAMRAHREAGAYVVVVSATFEPIAVRAMEGRPFDHVIATRMHVAEDGTYTARVEGQPVEGPAKVTAVRDFADARFGEGNWEVAFAYGDHHSDGHILKEAKAAYAVDPDRALLRMARRHGWHVLDW